MTTDQYLKALAKLNLTRAGKATAQALGVTVRAVQGYAAGGTIPEPVAKLLRCYLEHGLPAEKS